jgi:hypothetical protein
MTMQAGLRNQVRDALERDDVESLKRLLSAGDNFGLDPFDPVIALARHKVYAAMRQHVPRGVQTEARSSDIVPSSAPQIPSRPAQPSPPPPVYRGSPLVAVMAQPTPLRSDLLPPPTSRILDSEFLLAVSNRNVAVRPSPLTAAALETVSAGTGSAPSDPWGSYRHPWSATVSSASLRVGGDNTDTFSLSAASASAASSPLRGTAMQPAQEQRLPIRRTTWEAASPTTSTSIVHSTALRPSSLSQLGMALRHVVVSGPQVEGIVRSEGAARRTIDAQQRHILAHEMERFAEALWTQHHRTVRRALVCLEDDESRQRAEAFHVACHTARCLYRDFCVQTLVAERHDGLRVQETAARGSIESMEEFYRSAFATQTHRVLASAVSDWRRTTTLLRLEDEVQRILAASELGVVAARLPLLVSQPPSPHRSLHRTRRGTAAAAGRGLN